jgi:glycosyltransferase involved in cell wall biosynthesis
MEAVGGCFAIGQMGLPENRKKLFKILISAYACNPVRGSEEGVGWGWIRTISKYYEVTVITAEFHRRDIEAAVSLEPDSLGNIHFHYVPHKIWHYSVKSKVWLFIEGSVLKPVMNYAYRLWQRDAYGLAKELHKEHNFDLVHQLTYVGFRFPGYLWKLDIPFVWGPIGGIENTPWRFLPAMGIYGGIYYAGRNIINSLHRRFLRGPKMAFKKASGNIISATEGIRKEILRWYGEDSEVICEIGPPSNISADYSRRAAGDILRLSWSGLHLPGKALPLLLAALVQIPDNIQWALDIIGQGPCTRKWQKLAKRLGIAEHCNWHGWVARDESICLIHQSHIFVITSLKDLTSTVLLESLSQGVPVICPDHCGFSNVVTEDCGIKVPIIKPDQLVTDLAQAILTLAKDEAERQRLAKGALKRIEDFTWDKKAEKINAIYMRAHHGKSAKV